MAAFASCCVFEAPFVFQMSASSMQVLVWLSVAYWRRGWSNSGSSVVLSESRLFSLVSNDPYSRLVCIFFNSDAGFNERGCFGPEGPHDVRRRGGDRGWVTPDWEVFGCALSPCIPSRLLVGMRWRFVGDWGAVEGCGRLGVRWRGVGDWGCGGGVWAIGVRWRGVGDWGCGGGVWAIGGAVEGCRRLGVRWRGVSDWGCGGGVWAIGGAVEGCGRLGVRWRGVGDWGAVEGCGRLGVRWRGVGENGREQVGVDFIAAKKVTLTQLTTIMVFT